MSAVCVGSDISIEEDVDGSVSNRIAWRSAISVGNSVSRRLIEVHIFSLSTASL